MTDLNKSLEHCIKCSICQSVCPVAAHDAAYPGPKILGSDLARLQAAGKSGKDKAEELLPFLRMCASCLCCETACPFDIPVAQLIRQAKQASEAKTPLADSFVQGVFPRLRDQLLGHPERLGRMGVVFAPLVNALLGNSLVQKLMGRALGLEMERPHNFASREQRQRFTLELSSCDNQPVTQPSTISLTSEQSSSCDNRQADRRAETDRSFESCSEGSVANSRPKVHAQHQTSNHKLVYFTGCHVNYYQPEIGSALLKLLGLLGINPIVFRSHCCGLPLVLNGDREGAQKAFLRNIQQLKPYLDKGYNVVCTCPTCGLALKKFYPEELGTRDAEQLAAATYDYAEYLEDFHSELENLVHPVEGSFIFHLPCHTQAQGVSSANLNLMRLIPGLEMKIVDGCCGQAGTYGYKAEKKEVSRGISASLAQQIKGQSKALDTKTVLTPCSSCGYRISLECGVRAVHPLLLIWEAAVK